MGPVLAIVVTLTWIRRDEFIDREEAQHLLRALKASDLLKGRAPGGVSAAFQHSIEDHKPWYGWPFYVMTSAWWRLTGPSYDAGVLLNLPLLIAVLVMTGWLEVRLFGRQPVPLAVLVLSVLPGTLTWSHFYSPTMLVAASATLTCGLLLSTDALSRAWLTFLAGLAGAAATLVKVNAPFYFLPVAIWMSVIAGQRARRQLARGVALFSLGWAPGVAWWLFKLPLLAFWSGMIRSLLHPTGILELLTDHGRNWLFNLWPLHVLLLLGAVGVGLVSRRLPVRRSTVGWLLVWMAVPGILLIASTGNAATPRDEFPLLVPAALLISLASTAGGAGLRVCIGAVVLVHGVIHAHALLTDAGTPGSKPSLSRAALPTPEAGAMWGTRALPVPDILDSVVRELEVLAPRGTPSRCGCLPFPPYPVPSGRDRPVVLLDSVAVGPENLEAWLRLKQRPLQWQFGYVPYGLSCTAYRLALDCAEVILVGAEGQTAEHLHLASFRDRGPLRQIARDWGRGRGSIDLAPFGLFEVRTANAAGPCQATMPWVPRLCETCSPDFYQLHLQAVVARLGGEDTGRLEEEARLQARARLRDLMAGRDDPAVLFGEAYLARAVAGSASR